MASAKNIKGNIIVDILVEQTQKRKSDIRVILRCAGALSTLSLPKVESYAHYLCSMVVTIDGQFLHVFGPTRPKPRYWSKDPKHEKMVKRNKFGLSIFLG